MSTPGTAATAAPVAPRRFYRRRGFWIGSGLGLLALLVALVLLLYWLLQTVAGRDVLLAQLVARLPAGSSLPIGDMASVNADTSPFFYASHIPDVPKRPDWSSAT